jgi:hypothetical protein
MLLQAAICFREHKSEVVNNMHNYHDELKNIGEANL